MDEIGTPLYYSSLLGLQRTADVLLAKGAEVNAPSAKGADVNAPGDAEGHEGVVQLLLAKGADVNAPGGRLNGTALQCASDRGHEGVVQLLLAKGARDINTQGQHVNEI
ncbi:hypothetical protein N7449_004267 [Penicillium cf. viridicatum]|uniref:Ankyrin n=1 Tax=Penicillium cf. viridicatum TaxID=2972119 RepID=A0A9W9SXS5_9EURO|nr:hypothetical protein N7449_004267 [Penicillium cf. viridicatum]